MFRIVERPRVCSYLPGERASLEITFDPTITPDRYGELLRRGYRRFGWQVFRPVCRNCCACISMRVDVGAFTPGASDRRVLRQNQNIRAEFAPTLVSQEHVDLYNRYQTFMHVEKGWPLQAHSLDSYLEAFVAGPSGIGYEWRYFSGRQLVGVSLMDKAPGAISLVYFYYHPDWRRHSPGRFSILNQLQYAKQQGIAYAYLGYWVEACPSLNYKSRYGPHEVLESYVPLNEEPVWKRPHFPEHA